MHSRLIRRILQPRAIVTIGTIDTIHTHVAIGTFLAACAMITIGAIVTVLAEVTVCTTVAVDAIVVITARGGRGRDGVGSCRLSINDSHAGDWHCGSQRESRSLDW